MKNIERYFNLSEEDINQVLTMKAIEALIQCANKEDREELTERYKQWLLKSDKVILTHQEALILKLALQNEYLYIARDMNGLLFAYKEEPDKGEDSGCWASYCIENLYISDDIIPNCLSFIKWEDEEPYKVTEILDNSIIKG